MVPTPIPASERQRILLVQDDTVLRDALAGALRARTHDVVAVAHATHALAEARRAPPDVVVLDVANGFAFRCGQKRDPRLATIPVVAITADDSTVAHALDADLYMRKPVDPDALSSAIGAVVRMAGTRTAPSGVGEGLRRAMKRSSPRVRRIRPAIR